MLRLRKQHHALVVLLVLAATLYRGLIPAGFMPASGEAARQGAVLVICPHGEMGMHGHGGKDAGSSIEQCPFGAAAGPAAPSAPLSLRFAAGPAQFRPDWSLVLNGGSQPRLQPPARGPPSVS